MTEQSSQSKASSSEDPALQAKRKRNNMWVVTILGLLAVGFYLYTIFGGLAR